jgi:cell fate (sporulation/competence/biofilm development) regulator YlbF (YheA/YmcA/DUF963 family)
MDVEASARRLAQAIRDSDQYRAYQAARERVEADPALSSMVKDFREKSLAVQKQQWGGSEPDAAKLAQLEQLFEMLNYNPTIRDFLNCELELANLVADAQRILADAVDVWFDYSGEADSQGETGGRS